LLTCSCLFCRPCLQAHVESVFVKEASQIGSQLNEGSSDQTIDLTREPLESVSCPNAECSGWVSLSSAQQLAPEAFRMWEEAVNEAFFTENAAFVKCPGCDMVFEKMTGVLPPGVALTGVPELDRTAPFIELDNEGKRLSRSAMCHKATNRFRCRMCTIDFCGACREFPYHLGRSCEEVAEDKVAAKCLFCEALLRRWPDDKELHLRSVKALQSQLEREDVDAAWCVEKGDLVAVHRFVARVCDAKDCRKRARLSCTRTLECGHHCGGVRGERLCLPCLEEDCRRSSSNQLREEFLPSATDLCGICLVEPLRRAPSIRLQCGHVVHLHCAKQKLLQRYPGPPISFGYLNCPQCPRPMQHVSLDAYMRKHLELLRLVEEKAIKRLTMEGLLKSAKELQPGGSFYGRPSDFALYLYQYYMCSKCRVPYCGGKRDCMRIERDGENEAHNPDDLVCGGCSAAACGHGVCAKGHGKEYIEFKCAYCCSPATYFCFGRTHFCDTCHTSRPDMAKTLQVPECRGPEWCPLRVPHLPNGQECCLGCSMCRFTGQ
jgi:E3 ubiquitin-protein ligase MYCBP2